MIVYDISANARQSKALGGSYPIVPYTDHWSNHPSKGLTPSGLAAVLLESENGDMRELMELYEDILEKDPTIFGALETRRAAVLNKPWDIIPVKGSDASGTYQARFVRQMLEDLSTSNEQLAGAYASEWLSFSDLLAHLLNSVYYGLAVSELRWDPKTYAVIGARSIHPKHFVFGQPSLVGSPEWNPYELRIKTMEALTDGELLPLYKYIVQVNKSRPGLPTRAGLARLLTWWYLFKNYAIKSMMKAAELYGIPIRIGFYDPNDTGDTRAIIEQAVRGLGTDAAAVIAEGSRIEFPEVTPSSGDIHDKLVGMVNAEISKAVLGHTATTEAVPGDLGGTDQSMDVQYYRVQADARALEEAINNQIIRPVCRFRYGVVQCYFKIKYEAEEDATARATRYQTLAQLVEIPKSHIYETFDIPEPRGNEPATAIGGAEPAIVPAAHSQDVKKKVIVKVARMPRVKKQPPSSTSLPETSNPFMKLYSTE